jgi:prepilin-type N-terminal cleavage/methylation domain-containing protein/prepilin-type processing-associated H-X9-DG protein
VKYRGFTLVEVLVVVVLVAALSSTGFFLARQMILRARIAESSNNLRNLVIANQGYEIDHGVYCPADNQGNSLRWHGRRSSGQGKFDPTEGLLSPYLGKSRRVNICPLFQAMVLDAESFEAGTGGYGYNAAYIGGKPGCPWDRSTKLRLSERAANVWNPARTVMFTTTAYARAGGLQEYPYCEPPFWDFGSGPSGSRPSPSVHFRANGKAIVAWCDGSVTLESNNRENEHGDNPHGGDSHEFDLGWFGTEENNGAWNPRR